MVLNDYLPDTLTLHTYFNSLNSRLGDLGHLGLGDGRLVLIQWVQLEKKNKSIFLMIHGTCCLLKTMKCMCVWRKNSYIMNHHLYLRFLTETQYWTRFSCCDFDVMITIKGIVPLYSENRVYGIWCGGVARSPFTQTGPEDGLKCQRRRPRSLALA